MGKRGDKKTLIETSWDIDSQFIDTLLLEKVVKTFKVKNYNKKIKSEVIKNMEVEVEWVPLDDEKVLVKELNKLLNSTTHK